METKAKIDKIIQMNMKKQFIENQYKIYLVEISTEPIPADGFRIFVIFFSWYSREREKRT